MKNIGIYLIVLTLALFVVTASAQCFVSYDLVLSVVKK